MTGRRVFVTGATGFLGRHVVDALQRAGWAVLALVRSPAGLAPAAGVRAASGDLADLSLLTRCIDEADAVCHIAAHIPRNHEDPAEAEPCLRINGLLTLQLASAAATRGRRFLYFSANAYRYADGPVPEAAPMAPEERATYYITSKLVGEYFVEHLRRTAGLAAVSLRVGNVYGPGMPEKSVVTRFLAAGREGQPLVVRAGGVPTYDYVYATDVAAAAVRALEGGESGVYNIGGGRATSLRELAETVAALFPKAPPIVIQPVEGAAPAGFPGMDIGKAARAWGYAPLSLSEGLCRYLRQLETASR
jgi:UDP-glucose 4-epimerase